MRGWTSSSAAVASKGQDQLSQGQHRAVSTQHRPGISACMVPMVPCSILGNRDQHRPQLQQDHGLRHGPWQQRRPRCHHGSRWQCRSLESAWPQQQCGSWTSAWTQVGVQAPSICSIFSSHEVVDINTDLGCCGATDLDMALGSSSGEDMIMAPGGSAGQAHQFGIALVTARPLVTSMASQVVAQTQTPGIYVAFGGNIGHGCQH